MQLSHTHVPFRGIGDPLHIDIETAINNRVTTAICGGDFGADIKVQLTLEGGEILIGNEGYPFQLVVNIIAADKGIGRDDDLTVLYRKYLPWYINTPW